MPVSIPSWLANLVHEFGFDRAEAALVFARLQPQSMSLIHCHNSDVPNWTRLALSGCRARSFHEEDRWLGDARSHAGGLDHRSPNMAIQRQKPPRGLIHHSDRRSQYAAADYRKVLKAAGMIQSMSRKGNCWDNAPMETVLLDQLLALTPHCECGVRPLTATKISRPARRWSDE